MRCYSLATSAVALVACCCSALLAATPSENSNARPSSTSASPERPKNAIILFDDSNLDAWVSQKTKRWEESDGPADWKIVDGNVLEVVPGRGSLITKRRFG